MKVIYTPLENAGVLRVIPDGDYGDKYSFACTMTVHEGVARLYGAVIAPTPTELRAIRKELYKMGIHTILYHRIKDGKTRVRVIQLRG